MLMKHLVLRALCALVVVSATTGAWACRDAVVLVHGNTGSPSDWDNTVAELLQRGWSSSEIFAPSWGSNCAACNNHSGSEETPVQIALADALQASCTGNIDVIGHSMGATLAAKQLDDFNLAASVDAFVGIAGAFRGLWSCGRYPWNVWTSTCGYWGQSVDSPFLNALDVTPLASRVFSIKSWTDQIVCATGVCTVGGVHSSRISGETASYTFGYGHFGLQSATPSFQVNLIE